MFDKFDQIRCSKGAVVFTVMVALFVDMVVYGIVIPTIPKTVTETLGLPSQYVGILFASFAVGLLIVTPVAGYLSDKYHNRQVPMLVGLLGLTLATLLFGKISKYNLILLAFADSYAMLLVARIGQGISSGISWTMQDLK